ncbi:SAM hydrolase/SAM-dependent halogenase family protein [Ectothiorhodospira variabilis]|uniref:SAM hydrolase/SAM-dependent halogenase family protein n=1 Tax=Ectothiorhodospira variabilis TaxID=505694 RepID=UPI001EFB21FA|nr:SAM-dependent chlorinase/fluorinase [Ectothiorhodospira variabilis]MCG5495413.1 SAM-dependent chlorinase/fluorinase [Ectothiorhodospira variabilis]MCG5505011.1 SAM-dependent chlorinase/fluorinase [Ectothiorhodospira variabilis]MCG5508168.1 SAM-dependent chlorinase/fluorinase [Ectothiorhodospira variabilis]
MLVTYTDFGITGPYTGQLEAVLKRLAPGVTVVHLQADAPAFKPRAAGCLLRSLVGAFAPETVFVCVVDPGVGMDRDPIWVKAHGRRFVGPDNGLLAGVMRDDPQAEAHRIRWRPARLSNSFHGRDLFAPVAAALAMGEGVDSEAVCPSTLCGADWPREMAEVIYVDVYGNLVTGLSGDSVPPEARLLLGGREIAYRRVFGEAPVGELFWYVNSMGLVEVAVSEGSASRVLEMGIGAPLARADGFEQEVSA